MKLSNELVIALFDAMGYLFYLRRTYGCKTLKLKCYRIALEYYKKALKFKKKLFGKADVTVADSYINIGKVYCKFNKDKKEEVAEKYFKDALDIYVTKFGKESVEVADLYYKIGYYYFLYLQYTKALVYYLKALEIKENILGVEHIEVASLYYDIGHLYYKQDESTYLEYYALEYYVLEYFQKALKIQEKILGTEHEDTKWTYYCIADSYIKLGNNKKFIEYYKKYNGEK